MSSLVNTDANWLFSNVACVAALLWRLLCMPRNGPTEQESFFSGVLFGNTSSEPYFATWIASLYHGVRPRPPTVWLCRGGPLRGYVVLHEPFHGRGEGVPYILYRGICRMSFMELFSKFINPGSGHWRPCQLASIRESCV